nr:integrase, catalytic region, zinc finger, CCHC-type, peptidase aspartic, catalytic [Tanacetum cinerariifolium]
MVAKEDETSKDKEIDKLMALISLSFKKIYKPTNNNLRTSSNTSHANQDNFPRINRNAGYENQRIGNVAGARENVGSSVVQKSGIQCYNCKEYGHVARECQKPKRAKDAAYHREKMLLCNLETTLEYHKYDVYNLVWPYNIKEKEIYKVMALISLSFKKIYKPTNNNFRTSSNTSRANQDNSLRINKGTGYENQRIGNVARARETVVSTVVQKSRIQCYNCKEFGHVARECQKPKRVKDAAYHREKMLLYAADSRPIFDTEPVQKVSTDAHYNVFAIESEHPEQSKSVHDTYPIEQDEHNVIIDSLNMSYDREQIDQNDDDADLVNERELLASLIEKLKCAIYESKNRNKFLETSNKVLIEKLKGVIPTTSVSRPQLKSNPIGDKVMHNNSQGNKQDVEDHRRSVRTTMPIAMPVSTRKPKCTVKQSDDKPLKKIVASESNRKPRNITRKLYDHILRTVKFGNDQIAPILGYGDLVQGAVMIKWVYYVEGMNHNLFSIGQFCDADLEVAFRKSTCHIRDLKGNDLLTGSHGTDLYSITLHDTNCPNPICLMAKATSSQAWLWHRRLSHLNFDTINLLSKNDIVVGLLKLKFIKDHLCSSCELGKAKRKLVQRELQAQVRIVRTDKGTEFLNQTLHAYFATEGILHQTDDENLEMKEKGDACIFVGYSTQSRAYRVFNKRTRVIVETFHVNFDELPHMASDHVSSDPAPEYRTVTTLNELDLLFSSMFNELLNGSSKVVSKSSVVSTVDAPNQRLQQQTTPLNSHTTPAPTCQVPPHAPTGASTENMNQAEMVEEYAQVENDEFINIFCTPVKERGEISSRHVDSSNMHTFYQHHPSEHRWTKDHPLEQVIGNPSQSVRTRHQLESDGEMCMFALTEIKFYEKIRVLEFDRNNKNINIKRLTNELEQAKKEKEDLDSKLTRFQSVSKDLDNLLESQRSDKNKDGLRYTVVPPPPAQVYSPLKKDISWTGLPEFADDTITDYSRPSPAIESNSADLQNRNPSVTETEASSSTILSKPAIKFVKAADRPTEIKINKVETVKKPAAKYVELYRKTSKSSNVDQGKTWAKNNYTHKSTSPRTVFHKTGRFPTRTTRPNINAAPRPNVNNARQKTTQDLMIILIQRVKRLERELKARTPPTKIHKVDRGRSMSVMAWVPKNV